MNAMIPMRLFRNNRSQAVRIPRALAFPDDVRDVTIRREGDRLVLEPLRPKTATNWEEFFAMPGAEDFPEREQPPEQVRDRYFD
ncbi:type II toxin-antitoxin system VapB family antitoxin [Sandaracinobacteroides saxicola]|nr:type II toxin-antitoxin system VapB family antitoxin [Sandaracinobacteroides saxicola]